MKTVADNSYNELSSLRSAVDDISLPLIQLRASAESIQGELEHCSSDQVPRIIALADQTLRIAKSYAYAQDLNSGRRQLLLQPMNISSLLADSCAASGAVARQYDKVISLKAPKRVNPVIFDVHACAYMIDALVYSTIKRCASRLIKVSVHNGSNRVEVKIRAKGSGWYLRPNEQLPLGSTDFWSGFIDRLVSESTMDYTSSSNGAESEITVGLPVSRQMKFQLGV